MSENTKLWDILGRTDPKHTKPFRRAGGFTGTAIKPIWSFRRMTEEFGPCGTGWGVMKPEFQVVPGHDGEVLVYCIVAIWYGDAKEAVFGVGGDKVVGKNKNGLSSDDEAFKKAFTDAATNALKLIGIGADVHMGLFEDNKYVNSMNEEFSDPAPKQVSTRPNGTKSSAQIKREADMPDGWNAFRREIEEAQTIFELDKRRLEWSRIAIKDGWNQTVMETAKEVIDQHREHVLNNQSVLEAG